MVRFLSKSADLYSHSWSNLTIGLALKNYPKMTLWMSKSIHWIKSYLHTSMYANKPSVPGLLDKLRVEIGSHDSHIYMVQLTNRQTTLSLKSLSRMKTDGWTDPVTKLTIIISWDAMECWGCYPPYCTEKLSQMFWSNQTKTISLTLLDMGGGWNSPPPLKNAQNA